MKLSWGLLIAILIIISFISLRSVFAISPGLISTPSGEIASGESTTRAPLKPISNIPIKKLPQTGSLYPITTENQFPLDSMIEENTALDIPKINIHTLLYQGQLLNQELLLEKGGVFEYQNIIYAHNSTGSFGQIKNLKPGDMIYKTVGKLVSSFVVVDIRWADENNTDILTTDPYTLLLITCDFTNPSLRVVVTAEKIPKN